MEKNNKKSQRPSGSQKTPPQGSQKESPKNSEKALSESARALKEASEAVLAQAFATKQAAIKANLDYSGEDAVVFAFDVGFYSSAGKLVEVKAIQAIPLLAPHCVDTPRAVDNVLQTNILTPILRYFQQALQEAAKRSTAPLMLPEASVDDAENALSRFHEDTDPEANEPD